MIETIFALPHDLFVSADAMGESFGMRVGELNFSLLMPRLHEDEEGKNPWLTLDPPEFELIPPDFPWVDRSDDGWPWGMAANPEEGVVTQARVSRVGLRVSNPARSSEQPSLDHGTLEVIGRAWASVCDWVEVLTGQVHGIPRKTLTLGQTHPFWTGVEPSGTPRLAPIPGTVSLRPDRRLVQYVATSDVMVNAIARALKVGPPTEWLLLRDARQALEAGDFRRAALEAGTAAELSLTSMVENQLVEVPASATNALLVSHRTLGRRAELYEKLGGTLPLDTRSHLIALRNRAAHSGEVLPSDDVARALVVAEAIADRAYPDIAREATSPKS